MTDNIKNIRKHLLNDTTFKTLLNDKDAIYLIEKPIKSVENPYIVYLYKPIGTGGYITDFQIEFRIVGKDLTKLTSLQNRMITLLDFNRDTQPIEGIRHCKLLNGGGMVRNPETDNYELIVFFLCKI